MLPYITAAHVGYLPGEWIVGLFARRRRCRGGSPSRSPSGRSTRLHPRGVGVVVEAEHLCMTLRGVQAPGTTITSALIDVLREDPRSRAGIPLAHRRWTAMNVVVVGAALAGGRAAT